MWHHAQGFEQKAIFKAYESEEQNYIKTVKLVHRKQVPHDANIVLSHVLYMIKVEDDESLRLKARIAPHDKEDSDAKNLSFYCCMCSPTVILVLLFVSFYRCWRILKVHMKMAIHQTGPANRKVYVRPLEESRIKNKLWLLVVAGCELINANSKWQLVSYKAFSEV